MLVLIWGTAFALIEIALADVGPWWLTASRIGIAALLLTAVLLARGESLPVDVRSWCWFAWLGAVGNVAPFVFISWGQQSVPSSIAGILMASMPLMVIVLAARLLPDEPLSKAKIGGFTLGFVGLALMMDPGEWLQWRSAGAELLAPLAVLLGALGYALNSVTVRMMPPLSGLVLASGVIIAASIEALIGAILFEPLPGLIATDVWLSILALAVFPTALGALILYPLVRRAGASFVAITNYLVPVCAVIVGVVFLSEQLQTTDYTGLCLILLGIAIAQYRDSNTEETVAEEPHA